MTPEESALEAALMDAHARKDVSALARLYGQAGEGAIADGDIDTGCFYLTHAYVFALSAGLPEAGAYNQVLVAHGRDEAQADLPGM